MPVPRFIIKTISLPLSPVGSHVRLTDDEAHHLHDVLRLQVGASIELFSPESGQAFAGTIISSSSNECVAEIVAELKITPLPEVTLLLGVIRPAQCDFVCEKATELGLSAVSFFFAERSQHPLRGERFKQKLHRLERVRDAALKQSRSPRLTKVQLFDSFEAAMGNLHPQRPKALEHRLLCTPSAEGYSPKLTTFFQSETLYGSELENSSACVESYIAVGPEGGFTPKELETAVRHGYRTASLGSTTLRSETAAILASGLSMLLAGRE